MVYPPQTWRNNPAGGTPITAERLTHIETGIPAAITEAVQQMQDIIDAGGTVTKAEIEPLVAAIIAAGPNVSTIYDPDTGSVLISATGGVRSVNGDTSDTVTISLDRLTDVSLSQEVLDENGVVISPGPAVGDVIAMGADGVFTNMPIDRAALGLDQFYAPKDPNQEFLLYGKVVPLGGVQPTNLPDGSILFDENRPEAPLFSAVHSVSPAGSAQTLPSPLTATRSFYALTPGANLVLSFPAAPTTAGVVEIEVSLDQPATGTAGTATWPSNVKWDKRDGLTAPYVPVLETANNSRNTFRFRGALGVWECIGRWSYPGIAAPTPGPTPTFVNAVTGTTGLANNATGVTANWGPVINASDVFVGTLGIVGSTKQPNTDTLAALGITLLDGPITNHDTTPTLRTWLLKKKMVGNEDNATFTLDFMNELGAPGSTERAVLTGMVVRGGDFERVSWQVLRDTTVDTTMDVPAITPPVANSLIVGLNTARHGVVTGGGSMPSTVITDPAWTERADHNEGRDSSSATYSGWAGTRPISGGAGVEVPALTGTFNITATHTAFTVAVAPVNV